ncbi:MAG: hypothetical protein KatS3mg013_1239 [Actinomycetota bacterium]|nr:MAG: hypothetical protein KatS3mg013_1239 [Actinomycetota bacterium]
MNDVLKRTLTPVPVRYLAVPGRPYFVVTFPRRAGVPTAARLATRFGPMRFLFSQVLATREVEGGHRLETQRYAYKLTRASDSQPFVRWEYDRPKSPRVKRCRHHLQGPIRLDLGTRSVSLDEMHLPTGWVTFEEVIRFCIVDLGAQPRSADWNRVLLDSYELFKSQFAPLGEV